MIDITTPASPRIAGSTNTPDWTWNLADSDDYAYVTSLTSGLSLIDITMPTSPQIVGSVSTPEYAVGVSVSGDYAYVVDATLSSE